MGLVSPPMSATLKRRAAAAAAAAATARLPACDAVLAAHEVDWLTSLRLLAHRRRARDDDGYGGMPYNPAQQKQYLSGQRYQYPPAQHQYPHAQQSQYLTAQQSQHSPAEQSQPPPAEQQQYALPLPPQSFLAKSVTLPSGAAVAQDGGEDSEAKPSSMAKKVKNANYMSPRSLSEHPMDVHNLARVIAPHVLYAVTKSPSFSGEPMVAVACVEDLIQYNEEMCMGGVAAEAVRLETEQMASAAQMATSGVRGPFVVHHRNMVQVGFQQPDGRILGVAQILAARDGAGNNNGNGIKGIDGIDISIPRMRVIAKLRQTTGAGGEEGTTLDWLRESDGRVLDRGDGSRIVDMAAAQRGWMTREDREDPRYPHNIARA
ncbi:hypothetical protein GGR56DRAFT_672170 [Xylariaceae sp. FL0804]|nr:hypothetical protein GGR56DRAFT_672170 [Xylariaceae sp. FL0804]